MAPSLGTANHSALADHGPAHHLSIFPPHLDLLPLLCGHGHSNICLVHPAQVPCGDSAPLGSNEAMLLSASSEVQHLTWAGWREEQGLWASPVDPPKVFVARCVRTSIWGVCFPPSSSQEVCGSPRGSSGCRAAGSPSRRTARPSEGMHGAGSPPGLGDAAPLWDAADAKPCTSATRPCPGAHLGLGMGLGSWRWSTDTSRGHSCPLDFVVSRPCLGFQVGHLLLALQGEASSCHPRVNGYKLCC